MWDLHIPKIHMWTWHLSRVGCLFLWMHWQAVSPLCTEYESPPPLRLLTHLFRQTLAPQRLSTLLYICREYGHSVRERLIVGLGSVSGFIGLRIHSTTTSLLTYEYLIKTECGSINSDDVVLCLYKTSISFVYYR